MAIKFQRQKNMFPNIESKFTYRKRSGGTRVGDQTETYPHNIKILHAAGNKQVQIQCNGFVERNTYINATYNSEAHLFLQFKLQIMMNWPENSLVLPFVCPVSGVFRSKTFTKHVLTRHEGCCGPYGIRIQLGYSIQEGSCPQKKIWFKELDVFFRGLEAPPGAWMSFVEVHEKINWSHKKTSIKNGNILTFCLKTWFLIKIRNDQKARKDLDSKSFCLIPWPTRIVTRIIMKFMYLDQFQNRNIIYLGKCGNWLIQVRHTLP